MTQDQILEHAKDYAQINLNNDSILILAYELIEGLIYDLDYTEYKRQQNRLITVNEIIKEVLKNEKFTN